MEVSTRKLKPKKELDFTNQIYLAFKFMYIGKQYDGLVVQSTTKNTIEEMLFNAMRKCTLLPDKPTEILMNEYNYSRCGRTDKGVNSTGNIFSISLRNNPKYNYSKLINNLLPNDICILSYKEVDDSFDARFSCLYREYKYYFIKKNMNISKMNKALTYMKGLHNFRKFCKVDKSDPNWENKNYERRLYDISITKCDANFVFPFTIENTCEYYECYVCEIKGSAFLWHQVRCIMGVLFLIGNELEEPEIVKEMLNVSTPYEFVYAIADDCNLVLSNCVFEFWNFDVDDNTISDMYYKVEKIYQQNLIQIIIQTHFCNVILNAHNNIRNVIGMNNKVEYLNKKRKINKYTKMLEHSKNKHKHK